MKTKPYPLEDLRTFLYRRPWLVRRFLTPTEYQQIMERSLALPRKRLAYLRAFRDGWVAAKK